jgi:hypothetical protein
VPEELHPVHRQDYDSDTISGNKSRTVIKADPIELADAAPGGKRWR